MCVHYIQLLGWGEISLPDTSSEIPRKYSQENATQSLRKNKSANS